MRSIPSIDRRSVSLFPNAAFALGLFCLLAGAPANAAPRLRCEIHLSGMEQVFDFAPSSDPYGAAPVDLDGRFRFKAIVKGNDQQIEYVKIHVYQLTERQPVPIQVVDFQAPQVSGSSPAGLTGFNRLYAPGLGRELQYRCALIEVAP